MSADPKDPFGLAEPSSARATRLYLAVLLFEALLVGGMTVLGWFYH